MADYRYVSFRFRCLWVSKYQKLLKQQKCWLAKNTLKLSATQHSTAQNKMAKRKKERKRKRCVIKVAITAEGRKKGTNSGDDSRRRGHKVNNKEKRKERTKKPAKYDEIAAQGSLGGPVPSLFPSSSFPSISSSRTGNTTTTNKREYKLINKEWSRIKIWRDGTNDWKSLNRVLF